MTENVGYASMQIIPSFRGFEAATRRELSGKLDGIGRQTGESLGHQTSEGFGRSIGGMSRYAKAAAVGVTAALGAGLIGVGKWGLGIASANEQAQISFTTMLGSAEKAGAFLDDLKAFAASTPFEFPELQTAASSLISAGIEAGKVIPIMTTLGDVTAGMGTGSDGIKRATVALQQMQAAGKITGEDLNQLRDAGIPVYDLLAAATGKAKTEVSALAQAGKLGKTELDELMSALESGAGLERFSGLMDKQSQSLAGLGSTLKDNLGQGLATAMEPTVGLLKDALPTVTDLANDGVAVFGRAVAEAIEAGQDFAAWITPIAEDVGGHLVPVMQDLYEIAGDTLPAGFDVLGGAIVGVQQILNPFLDLVHEGTSFLADHNEIVLAAAGAYAAWKAVDFASDLLGAEKITNATTALRNFVTVASAKAAVDGISQTQSAMELLASTTVSRTAIAGGALAGFVGGAAIAFATLERSADHGRTAAEQFVDSLHVDTGNTASMQTALTGLNDEIQRLNDGVPEAQGWWETMKGGLLSNERFKQRIDPFDKNTIDESESKQQRLSRVVVDYAKDLKKLYGAASLLGESSGTIDAWVRKLDINIDDFGPKRLAYAIGEARNAAENGTPSTDKLSDAYATLTDKTASSTDKIDAWKDALDNALDKPQSLFDATTAYAQGLEDFRKTVTEGSWGQFGTDTEAGRKNRDALSGMVDNVQDLAHAYADMGDNDKAAETIRQGREQIVEAGTAAGLSETQVRDYMESLGLTEGTWKAQIELNGADGAKNQMDTLNGLLANFDGKHAQAYIDLALNAPWIQGTDWWDRLVTDGVSPWFLGGSGDAPAGDAPAGDAPSGDPMPRTGGDPGTGKTRRRSGAKNITINTPATSTRAISDELLWAS